MGAIDGHNFRRQSGKSTGSFEKICVTRNTKDRVFITIVSWILINIYLLRKYFMWGKEAKKKPGELQEQVAMALINNNLLAETQEDSPCAEDELPLNDMDDCKQHPEYKQRLCRACFNRRTVYYCVKCSDPARKKLRKEKGPKGSRKYTEVGYMHFCRHGGCFLRHKCGHVRKRRTKEEMESSTAFRI